MSLEEGIGLLGILSRLRPTPWEGDLSDGFEIDRMNAQIHSWQAFLGLGQWRIAFSTQKVGADERAHADIDLIHRIAAISLRNDLPGNQVDRELVHELAHVAMAELEDLFLRAGADLGKRRRRQFEQQWKRAQEPLCDALADALVGVERMEWIEEPWRSAFPVVR
jgi:hypothetical protein